MIEICPNCDKTLDSTLYVSCPYCGALIQLFGEYDKIEKELKDNE